MALVLTSASRRVFSVPVKVVSERLGHASPGFTIDTSHVLPGMQADAATIIERLVGPGPNGGSTR